jgi:hypothetical protein
VRYRVLFDLPNSQKFADYIVCTVRTSDDVAGPYADMEDDDVVGPYANVVDDDVVGVEWVTEGRRGRITF